uniref:Uncharacterized protein n=1 Tax=Klebsiella phage HenuGS TaxID=3350566 RepID=A0AB74UK99_9CAUD
MVSALRSPSAIRCSTCGSVWMPCWLGHTANGSACSLICQLHARTRRSRSSASARLSRSCSSTSRRTCRRHWISTSARTFICQHWCTAGLSSTARRCHMTRRSTSRPTSISTRTKRVRTPIYLYTTRTCKNFKRKADGGV